MRIGRVVALISSFWNAYGSVIALVLVLAASIVAFYLRAECYVNVVTSGIGAEYPEAKLNELDPFINWWLVKYLDSHGPLSWFELNRNNPATCLFWYPWCRDFYRTELPGHIYSIYILYEIAKPFGVKLFDLMALLPPLLAAVCVVGVALLVNEVTGSRLMSIIAAWFAALMYMDRTVAGFIVKYTFGIAVVPFVLWLHFKALKSGKPWQFVVSGLVMAYALSVWSGFPLTFIPVALSYVSLPIFAMDVRELMHRKFLTYAFIEVLIPTIVGVLIPYYGVKFFVSRFGVLLILSYVAMLIGLYLRTKLGDRKGRYVYIALIVIGVAASIGGLYALYLAGIHVLRGKVAIALGLPTARLPQTVAEYQPIAPGSMSFVLAWFTAIAIFVIGLPMIVVTKKWFDRVVLASICVWVLLCVYAVLRIAYFSSYLSICSIIAVSILGGYLLRFSAPRIRAIGKYTRIEWGFDRAIALLILLFLIGWMAWRVVVIETLTLHLYQGQMTTIATAEYLIPFGTTVWLDALKFIRENTSSNALVVSWWDYGYWLSPLGNRSTVADGSTINASQISVLARFFTGPINESYVLLKNFGLCSKDEVYVVIFGVANVVNYYNSPTIYYSLPVTSLGAIRAGGDIPKFIAAMVYIATGVRPFELLAHDNATVGTFVIRGSTIEIVRDSKGWISVGVDRTTFPPRIAFVSLAWSVYVKKKPTLPTLFAYGVYQALKKLYPNKHIKLVRTSVIALGVGGRVNIIVPQPDRLEALSFNPEIFKPDAYELVHASVSKPLQFKLSGLQGELDQYVFVLVFKLKDEIREELCKTS